MLEHPLMYHEPESEPVNPGRGQPRPWTTLVKGFQSAAPIDLRGIILGIFQRIFTMFFSGAPGGGAGGIMGGLRGRNGALVNDERSRAAKIQEFHRNLTSEIQGVIRARNSGQLNHYLQVKGYTTISPSTESFRLPNKTLNFDHYG